MRISILLLVVFNCLIDEIGSARIRREKSGQPHAFETCFENLGCIDFTEKWFHEKYRPHNLEPLDRHTIRTEFLLMKNPKTNSSEGKEDLLYDILSFKKETVEVSGFKKGTCSIFVIHDFTSNGYTGWIKHIVVAFSKKTDCNIISIDWQAGAEPPFEQAISNARVVALETKLFIQMLKACFRQSTDALHLIGHGVGAHIAGYIGKSIHRVQRITGLDPTGPMFEHMPKEVRLDESDAKYVEILHTDAFNHRSQGSRITHGHANFMINDAQHQPGCNDSSHMPSFLDLHRDSLQEGKILPACSHKRSFKYYIQALEDTECQFLGIRCPNYPDFLAGKCNNCEQRGNCATFGLEPPCVSTSNNTYYLLTNSHKPYCLLTYAVNISIDRGATSKEEEGYFEIIMVDQNDKVTNASTGVHKVITRKFQSGETYRFIFYGPSPAIDAVKEAKVKWTYKSKKVCIMCDKTIKVKDISIQRLTLSSKKPKRSFICPATKGEDLKSGDYIEFVACESLYGSDYSRTRSQAKRVKPNNVYHAWENNPCEAFADAGGNAKQTGPIQAANAQNTNPDATTSEYDTTTQGPNKGEQGPKDVQQRCSPTCGDKKNKCDQDQFNDCFDDSWKTTTTAMPCDLCKKSAERTTPAKMPNQ